MSSNTKIQFLSHASCLVKTNKVNILMDPWLIGSYYWRSWWNYPPVKEGLINNSGLEGIVRLISNPSKKLFYRNFVSVPLFIYFASSLFKNF